MFMCAEIHDNGKPQQAETDTWEVVKTCQKTCQHNHSYENTIRHAEEHILT